MHRSSHKPFYDRVNKKHLWQCSLILGFRWGRKIMVSFVISFKTLFETTYDWVSILAKYYELSVHIVTRKKCLKSILSLKKIFARGICAVTLFDNILFTQKSQMWCWIQIWQITEFVYEICKSTKNIAYILMNVTSTFILIVQA